MKPFQFDPTDFKEGESFDQYFARYLKETKQKIVYVNESGIIESDSWEEGLQYSLAPSSKKLGDKL